MRIAVGSDHRGIQMRERVLSLLKTMGQEPIDVGTRENDDVDYPDVAVKVAEKVSRGEVERGVLICATGLGMCIVANKFPGVRAAPCHDEVSVEIARRHNDLNVLCLSGEIMAECSVDRLVEIWLNTAFDGGRHARRVQKIHSFENHNGKR
jgi:ribose 5-phosphate isomerase B